MLIHLIYIFHVERIKNEVKISLYPLREDGLAGLTDSTRLDIRLS